MHPTAVLTAVGRKVFRIVYGQGAVSGHYCVDDVAIGDLVLKNFTFAEVSDVSGLRTAQAIPLPIDGCRNRRQCHDCAYLSWMMFVSPGSPPTHLHFDMLNKCSQHARGSIFGSDYLGASRQFCPNLAKD